MDRRKAALWENGQDEAVSVNQRALIDKVLARYSGEYTIFRELIQNADDALARSVQIKFYTKDWIDRKEGVIPNDTPKPTAIPDFKIENVHRYTFLNDGTPFRPEDWNRLKKIAEGNPDESKIGAFGVGFYSLFSVTEEPYVESNDKWMGFYWKDGGDQLFARSGSLPPSTSSTSLSPFGLPLTSFTMDLRTPSPLPGPPLDLARFLVSSLTFMNRIEKAELWFDDLRLVLVQKEMGSPKALKMVKELWTKSTGGTMTVSGISSTGVQISAQVMRAVYEYGSTAPLPVPTSIPKAVKAATSNFSSMLSLFGRSSPAATPHSTPTPPPAPVKRDPFELLNNSMSLKIFTAQITTNLSRDFARELERSTKKPPPKASSFSLIYTGKEATESGSNLVGSQEGKGTTHSVFRSLEADLDGRGTAKIFIGHATGQTTGIGGHISARFIPTVERESIDLVDRYVAMWNKELLWVGGFLARSVYELEMEEIKTLWDSLAAGGTQQPNEESKMWLIERAIHTLRFFAFNSSTPSLIVSRDMETAFFASSRGLNSISFPSTQGIFSAASQVRMPHPDLLKFLPNRPFVPQLAIDDASFQISKLRLRGMLKDISLDDILDDLKTMVLSEQQLVDCMKWWIGVSNLPNFDISMGRKVSAVAVFSQTNTTTGEDTVIPLSSITTFVNPRSFIPAELPLPITTLPTSISRALQIDRLELSFGIKELSIADWLVFLLSPAMVGPDSVVETDMTRNAFFAEKVLEILARAWGSIGQVAQAKVFELASKHTVIPTRAGMSLPEKAYFENVDLFPDLAIVALPMKSPIKGKALEKMLKGLGVRGHVELQLVFSRLITSGDWNVNELIRYLVSVKETLSSTEMDKLRQTAAFPRYQPAAAPSQSGIKPKIERLKPDALYEPTDQLRALGLPILDWVGKFNNSSAEAKFLFSLGLRRHPPVDELLTIAADPNNHTLRVTALAYLTENFDKYYATTYHLAKNLHLPFIPAISSTGSAFMASPREVYLNSACSIMGFSTVASSIRPMAQKLKVQSEPPASLVLESIASAPPLDLGIAQRQFEYCAGRISDFLSSAGPALRKLSTTPIIPIKRSNLVKFATPAECYFISADGMTVNNKLYRSIFTFVDFGSNANAFLQAIGTKAEPSVQEVAQLMAKEPDLILEKAGTHDVYLNVLRNLASNINSISNSTLKDMRNSPCVLAHRRVKAGGKSSATDDEDFHIVWRLCKPTETVVVDDTVSFLLFAEDLNSVPEEDLLESFYSKIGAVPLSSVVKDQYSVDPPMTDQSILAQTTLKLVLERITLFLHERSRSTAAMSIDSIKKELRVVEVKKLRLTRALRFLGSEKINSQVVSAYATRDRSSFTLAISSSVELEYYEIASCLCKIILRNPRPEDSLLLSTILSTPLASLKRRGFNTDRILNQRRAEKEALDASARAAAVESEKLKKVQKEVEEIFPDVDSTFLAKLIADMNAGSPEASELLKKTTNRLLEKPYPTKPPPSKPDATYPNVNNSAVAVKDSNSTISNPPQPIFDDVKKRSGGLLNAFRRRGNDADLPFTPHNGNQPPSYDDPNPTPASNIRDNVMKAIRKSGATRDTSLQSSGDQLTNVKESADNYCDAGAKTDLKLASTLSTGMKFYVDRALHTNSMTFEKFMSDNTRSMERFAQAVIRPVGHVFGLAPDSLHMFYDQTGPLIAFNRAGAIFCNLRFYQAWHDQQVIEGKLQEALTSWFFSIAHEIAHNIIIPHNSQHEFYFSSICEEFTIPFAKLVLSADSTARVAAGAIEAPPAVTKNGTESSQKGLRVPGAF